MCSMTAKQHEKYVYKNIPSYIYTSLDAHLQMVLICASASAKYIVYNFKEMKYRDGVKLSASTSECSFFLTLNRKTNECEIEFKACNDSFSYSSFKSMIDTFFLSEEC